MFQGHKLLVSSILKIETESPKTRFQLRTLSINPLNPDPGFGQPPINIGFGLVSNPPISCSEMLLPLISAVKVFPL